jgi:hypothetical protein
VAEDNFEAVDPLARVSRAQGIALFDSATELIPQEVDGGFICAKWARFRS